MDLCILIRTGPHDIRTTFGTQPWLTNVSAVTVLIFQPFVGYALLGFT